MDRSELAHYGVKGMKWGVRKAEDSGPSTPRRAPASDDHKEVEKLKSVSTRSLSNADLKALNNRMQLEQTYRQLIEKENDHLMRGEAAFKKLERARKLATNAAALAQNPMVRKVAVFAFKQGLRVATGGASSAATGAYRTVRVVNALTR